jgi:uncharacterized protein YndB with AHSA1/START domain
MGWRLDIGFVKGEARITIAAPAAQLYDMVTDVTRMHEWSPETFDCQWLDGARTAAPGAKFKGSNKAWFLRWSTTPKVEVAEPGKEFTFDTGSTRWSYTFHPQGDDTTQVVESFETHGPWFLEVANTLTLRERQLNTGVQKTLANLKRIAESSLAR